MLNHRFTCVFVAFLSVTSINIQAATCDNSSKVPVTCTCSVRELVTADETRILRDTGRKEQVSIATQICPDDASDIEALEARCRSSELERSLKMQYFNCSVKNQ